MNDKLHSLLNFILKDLFNAPVEDDMLRFDGNVLWSGDNKLSYDETVALVEEAKIIQRLTLTKILNREMKTVAIKKLGAESHNWEETFFAKAMLYFQDVFNKKIDNIANLKPKGQKKQKQLN